MTTILAMVNYLAELSTRNVLTINPQYMGRITNQLAQLTDENTGERRLQTFDEWLMSVLKWMKEKEYKDITCTMEISITLKLSLSLCHWVTTMQWPYMKGTVIGSSILTHLDGTILQLLGTDYLLSSIHSTLICKKTLLLIDQNAINKGVI